jgi:hypothetical protein
MIVAYYISHNEGVEHGILENPGDATGSECIDLSEVDAEIQAFATKAEALAWLNMQPGAHA